MHRPDPAASAFLTGYADNIRRLLSYGWAYAEAAADVQVLLFGGKVPLIKTADEFRMTPAELPADSADLLSFRSPDESSPDESDPGYRQHLFLLAILKDTAVQAWRIADLIEYEMRYTALCRSFRIDNCLAACRMELSAYAAGNTLCSAQCSWQSHL